MVPAYRGRKTLVHGLHPAAMLALALALLVMSLASANPVCQASVILAAGLLALAAGVFKEWASWWKLCAAVGLAALIINPLISRQGTTLLWIGPKLPVIGRVTITAEAVAFGAVMALRLAAIIWVFALVTLTVDPDAVLGLMRGKGSRSALVSALSMRLVPTMTRDAGELLDAQRARGLARDSGGRFKVLASRLPLVKRMFTTALDRGVGLAEAMEARAYGSGRRTRYRVYRFKASDVAVVAFAAAVAAAAIAGAVGGATAFACYPSLSMPDVAGTVSVAMVAALGALAALSIAVLWKKSDWLRLRI